MSKSAPHPPWMTVLTACLAVACLALVTAAIVRPGPTARPRPDPPGGQLHIEARALDRDVERTQTGDVRRRLLLRPDQPYAERLAARILLARRGTAVVVDRSSRETDGHDPVAVARVTASAIGALAPVISALCVYVGEPCPSPAAESPAAEPDQEPRPDRSAQALIEPWSRRSI